MKCVAVVLGIIIATVSVVAQQLDTLRTYSEHAGYVYYADPAITMQAARFEADRPLLLHGVTIMLGGPSADGSAVLHVYGHEGGLPAPGLQRDLIAPIRIRKSRAGAERVSVSFTRPVAVNTHQFFIALDNLTPGAVMLSDRGTPPPTCVAAGDNFAFQALRDNRGEWRWGAHSFLVASVVEYAATSRTRSGLVDVTASLGFPDSAAHASSIAWADIDRDGYADLLCDGMLYRNVRGEKFENITRSSGIPPGAGTSVFIDADNDAAPDVLAFQDGEGADGSAALYLNAGNGRFERKPLSVPALHALRAVSICDADDDGYLDVLLGAASADDGRPSCRLLVNDRHDGFLDRTDLLEGEQPTSVSGSQWADLDGDGDLDLFVASNDSAGDYMWLRDAHGRFLPAGASIRGELVGGGTRVGCDWADYDNDGDLDLLLPLRRSVAAARGSETLERSIVRNAGAMRLVGNDDAPIEYEEQRAAGAWADIDNDGLLDMVLTTSCGCRYASIYRQEQGGGFRAMTADYGFARRAAGKDAVWVDYDNDGRLDLATFVDGRFRLFHNTIATPNNFIGFDPQGVHAVGARVEVFCRGVRYTREVTSGRGRLMQEPTDVLVGIGTETRVDSVHVRWANGHVDTSTDLAARTIHRLSEGEHPDAAGADGARDLSAAPNPASDRLHIRFSLAVGQELRLGVYTLDGVLLKTLLQGVQKPGAYDVIWDLKNQSGERAAQGTYIYRLLTRAGEQGGKFIVVH